MLVLFKHRQELSGVLSSQWIVQVYITMLVSARRELSKLWWMWWGLVIDLLPIFRSNKTLLNAFLSQCSDSFVQVVQFFCQHTLWRNSPSAHSRFGGGSCCACCKELLLFLLHCVFFSWASWELQFVQESCLPQTAPFHFQAHLYLCFHGKGWPYFSSHWEQ